MRTLLRSVACIILSYSFDVFALSPNATGELIERLFTGYNAQASPYAGQESSVGARPLSVQLRLSRAIINSVNERDWTISMFVTVHYKWRDPRLSWDPSTAEGINGIAVKSDAVWQPDFYPCESTKVSPVYKDLPASGVIIDSIGNVRMDAYQVNNYYCQMNFDAFPFDSQHCSICFQLDGPSGASLMLEDFSAYPIELRSNSEWDVIRNLTREDVRMSIDGVQSHRVLFHFSLKRRPFFWIFLIIVPTCLFCLVTLAGVFFYDGDDTVQNAASIGLTTMTSIMLVVTILSDDLDKSDNLPGLGWFVFVEIVVVCVSVIAVLILDGGRSAALSYWRRHKEKCPGLRRILTSKRVYRATRITLFLIAIVALILNPILNWAGRDSNYTWAFGKLF